VYNLNPTPFPRENKFRENRRSWTIFKLNSKSQDQVQFHLGDVPVGLRSQTVIKQVERSVLQSSDWFPEARKKNQKVLKLGLYA